jgi:DNA modification methylase
VNTNRNFIGIENNMDYFNISLKRVEEKRKEKEFNVVASFGDGNVVLLLTGCSYTQLCVGFVRWKNCV